MRQRRPFGDHRKKCICFEVLEIVRQMPGLRAASEHWKFLCALMKTGPPRQARLGAGFAARYGGNQPGAAACARASVRSLGRTRGGLARSPQPSHPTRTRLQNRCGRTYAVPARASAQTRARKQRLAASPSHRARAPTTAKATGRHRLVRRLPGRLGRPARDSDRLRLGPPATRTARDPRPVRRARYESGDCPRRSPVSAAPATCRLGPRDLAVRVTAGPARAVIPSCPTRIRRRQTGRAGRRESWCQGCVGRDSDAWFEVSSTAVGEDWVIGDGWEISDA